MIPSVALWVLVVFSGGMGGATMSGSPTVTMQSFLTQEACERTAKWLKGRSEVKDAYCVRSY